MFPFRLFLFIQFVPHFAPTQFSFPFVTFFFKYFLFFLLILSGTFYSTLLFLLFSLLFPSLFSFSEFFPASVAIVSLPPFFLHEILSIFAHFLPFHVRLLHFFMSSFFSVENIFELCSFFFISPFIFLSKQELPKE